MAFFFLSNRSSVRKQRGQLGRTRVRQGRQSRAGTRTPKKGERAGLEPLKREQGWQEMGPEGRQRKGQEGQGGASTRPAKKGQEGQEAGGPGAGGSKGQEGHPNSEKASP